jgi:adenosylcobinamide kinase/adenosylcobinamide-phosphate guanylyltransferase
MALVVITGGARSGKSSAAQRLAESRARDGVAVTVAVFASDSDAEMTERIARHRADRPGGFTVIEADGSLSALDSVAPGSLLLLDCLGTALGVAMLQAWESVERSGASMAEADELPPGFEAEFSAGAAALVERLLARCDDTIVVTNEVGSGIVPAYPTGRVFRDVLGRANATLVNRADVACASVAGRLLDLSALPRELTWPHD